MTNDPPRASRESERRFATVVFADVSGFTAMSERVDPEEVTAIMNRCFEILEHAVTHHGGHVDKYIGDCIMALFGVPKALEHAPAHAVHAALEMLAGIRSFTREQRLPAELELHVGINSGLVLAGEVGGTTTRDFTVMGDTVNLASRLKDASPKGDIWVGPQTYRYTRGDFAYEALKPLTLKGKEQPIPAYRVTGVKARTGPATRAPADGMIFSGLVGRERELEVLAEAVARVCEGTGGIVSIVAEAGLGKSRLLAEMAALDAMRGVTVLRGAALAVGRTLPFHLFIDVFRQWAAIGESEGDHEAVAKLEAAIAAVAPAESADLVPFVATMMGLRLSGAQAERIEGIEGEAMEKLIQKSVRELLQRLADRAPVVLVLEDLHWADASSATLLESLLRLAVEARVLFVHAFRPEHAGAGHHLEAAAQKRFPDRHVTLALEPLSAKQCDALACNLLSLDDLPYGALGALLRKAEGNPFFIEEVIRSLIDEGAVEYKEGRFRVTAKIDTVVIPGTIQEVIMGRIDRLPEPVRRVLQGAAVIGRSFHPSIVAAILPEEHDLEWSLGYLKKRQLIVPRRAHGDLEYVFKHALGQETIYESILQKTRRELHAAVAGAIETTFAERLPEFYGMLAYHYSRAERLEQAEEYLFKAGDEAVRSAASSEALSYFQEASRLYFLLHGEGGDPLKKALLEKNIGMALLNKGNLAECIPPFNRALAHLGEPAATSTIRQALQGGIDLVAVLAYLYVRPPWRRAVRDAERLREAIEIRYHRAKAQTTTDTTRFFFDTIASIRRLNHADPVTVDEACGMYAGGAALFSFSGVSFGIGARFLDIAGRLVRAGNVRDEVAYRSMRFIHHYLAGDWSASHRIDQAMLEQGLRYGQLWEVCAYLGLNAQQRARQGDFAGAERNIERLARIADAWSSDFATSNRDGETAALLVERRQLDDASRAVRHYYTSRLEKLFNLLALGWEAKLELLRGDRAQATKALADAEQILARQAHVPPFHRSPYCCSRLLYDLTALEEAITAADHARIVSYRAQARRSARLVLGNASRVAIDRTESFNLVGRLYWLLGKPGKAVRAWERSLADGERLGARPELARTHLEIAQRLRGEDRIVAGLAPSQHLERARSLFTELELTWDLEQLARLEGHAAAPLPDAAQLARA